jgi:hypothetical protein
MCTRKILNYVRGYHYISIEPAGLMRNKDKEAGETQGWRDQK